MARIRFGGRTIYLPRSRILRIFIGSALILGGFLGIFPILGFWMLPLGLLVLSIDVPVVRRWRRQAVVRIGQWLKVRAPRLAARLGYNNGSPPP